MKILWPALIICSLIGCTSSEKKVHPKKTAIFTVLRQTSIELQKSLDRIRDCLSEKAEKPLPISVKGKYRTEGGYLILSEMTSNENDSPKTLSCIQDQITRERKNVAHGIFRNEFLQQNDQVFEFEASILPKKGGFVKSEVINEIVKF